MEQPVTTKLQTTKEITEFVASDSNTSQQIATSKDKSDDEKLTDLLKEFEMLHLFEVLKNCGITFRSLKYLSKDDLKVGIPNVWYRMEFREKLFSWRRRVYNNEHEPVSLNAKVEEWVAQNNIFFHSPLPEKKCDNLSKNDETSPQKMVHRKDDFLQYNCYNNW